MDAFDVSTSLYVSTYSTVMVNAQVSASSIKVCHNRRISQHRVFDGHAARGKTSVGWFFGLKLHLVINDRGELLN
nr:transposase [[Leptolyngbya] sp. PCC 7376]